MLSSISCFTVLVMCKYSFFVVQISEYRDTQGYSDNVWQQNICSHILHLVRGSREPIMVHTVLPQLLIAQSGPSWSNICYFLVSAIVLWFHLHDSVMKNALNVIKLSVFHGCKIMLQFLFIIVLRLFMIKPRSGSVVCFSASALASSRQLGHTT